MQRNRAVYGHNKCKCYYYSQFHNDPCICYCPHDNDDFCSADDNDHVHYDNLVNDFSTRNHNQRDDIRPTDANDNVCYDNLINDFRTRGRVNLFTYRKQAWQR